MHAEQTQTVKHRIHQKGKKCIDCEKPSFGIRCWDCRINQARKYCANCSEKFAVKKGLCENCYRRQLRATNENSRKGRNAVVLRWRQHNRDKVSQYKQEYQARPANKDRHRKYLLKRVYGITEDEYYAMVTAQLGCCGICSQRSDQRLHIDHDHQTGVVRQLLCNRCNTLVGFIEKSAAGVVQTALAYIEKYKPLLEKETA